MSKVDNQFGRAKNRMAVDIRSIIADSEELLEAAAAVSDEKFTVARKKFEGKLSDARSALADVSQPVLDRAKQTVADADNYVRGNPWTTVGIAVAAAALIGFLTSKR